eukprot:GFYU01006640.1.p1 GENE.GFYU01006640.1~~GFYU01006640.1.p1  ORF type:complete len:138 (-),score=46.93 GFYU01006640.1:248-661(-)
MQCGNKKQIKKFEEELNDRDREIDFLKGENEKLNHQILGLKKYMADINAQLNITLGQLEEAKEATIDIVTNAPAIKPGLNVSMMNEEGGKDLNEELRNATRMVKQMQKLAFGVVIGAFVVFLVIFMVFIFIAGAESC